MIDVSILIPVLDDGVALARLLAELSRFDDHSIEVIVIDGGSTDDSVDVAQRAGVRLLDSSAARGQQINLGVCYASGRWLWMLHADSRVSLAALTYIRSQSTPGWGRFDVAFDPDSSAMRLVAGMMNGRSRLTGICTGDQGLFVHQRLLERAGGVPEQPLMEDIELSRRLKRLSQPRCPRVQIVTAPRRWQKAGVLNTILFMWRLRFRYWLGSSPEALADEYYG